LFSWQRYLLRAALARTLLSSLTKQKKQSESGSVQQERRKEETEKAKTYGKSISWQ